jgi:hypothetical protein
MAMKHRKANFRDNLFRNFLRGNLVFLIFGISSIPGLAGEPAKHTNFNKNRAAQYIRNFDFESLSLAITDLIETFGQDYPKGVQYLEHLSSLKKQIKIILGSFDRNNNIKKDNL